MKSKLILIVYLLSIGIVHAQYQNYELKSNDNGSKSYIGRDFVKLLPGYSYKPSGNERMNARVETKLSTNDLIQLLSAGNLTETVNPNSITTISKTLAVGQIPITSFVSQNGAKCYNVPIEVEPGRQGFQPNLSLCYDSQKGNGTMGMGWAVGGLSSIRSVGCNTYYDGVNSPTGSFELDGIRLIRKSWSVIYMDLLNPINSIYKSVFESVTDNIVVTAITKNGIYTSFYVQYPNGNVGTYINLWGTDSPICFPISKLTDVNGNEIEYTYLPEDLSYTSGNGNEVYYIDEIKYGKCADKDHFAKIKFNYERRGDRVFEIQSGKYAVYIDRLLSIQVFNLLTSTPIRTYGLSYTNHDNRLESTNYCDVSRLTQISCSASDVTLNPIKFYNGEKISDEIVRTDCTFSGRNFDGDKNIFLTGKLIDNNNDDHLIVYPKGEFYKQDMFLIANNNGFAYPAQNVINVFKDVRSANANTVFQITAGEGFESLQVANIDGDKSDEIVKVNTHYETTTGDPIDSKEYFTFSIYKLDSDSLILSKTKEYKCDRVSFYNNPEFWAYPIGFTTPRKYFAGNFTGKGKSEILSIPNLCGLIEDTPGGFNKNVYLFDLSTSSLEPAYKGIPFSIQSDNVYAMDIDGDGQTEIISVGLEHTDLYKYKSGSGFEDIGDWSLNLGDYISRQIMFADLNGDGNIDIVKTPVETAVAGTKIYAPEWARHKINVYANCYRCDKCHYVQMRISRDPSSGRFYNTSGYIGIKGHTVIDYSSNPTSNNSYNAMPYPRLVNNNDSVESYCPGCGNHLKYQVVNYDEDHCWVCGKNLLHFLDARHCPDHNYNLDYTNWYCVAPVVEKDNNWTYLFTDGKSVVMKFLYPGPTRENNYKYSIHESDGDDTPDLFVQKPDGTTLIYPFDVQRRGFFRGERKYIENLPQSYEFLDFEVNSGSNVTNMIALGSDKVVSLNFIYNHTRNSMISLMVNSLGVVDKTDYSQLYRGAIYTPGSSAQYPYTDYEGSMFVVNNECQIYNNTMIGNKDYKYGEAIVHNQGLGFLGFKSMVATDLMSRSVETTEFDPYKMGTITKQSNEKEETTYEYEYSVDSNKKQKLLLSTKTDRDKLQGNSIISTYSTYDIYGNAGKEIIDFGNGIKTTSTYCYDNRLNNRFGPTDSNERNLIGLLLNKKTTNEREGNSFVISKGYIYNTNGQLQFVKDSVESKLVSSIEYTYDPTYKGTILGVTHFNAISNDYLTTTYSYWDNDNSLLKTQTDPLGRVTTYNYDFNKRLLSEVVDFRNKTTVLGYDNVWRRMNKISRPDGTVEDITLGWSTDSDPRLLIKETRIVTGKPVITKNSDAFGRETRISTGGFDGLEVYSDNYYDNYGRLKSKSTPHKAADTELLTVYNYDAYDRPESFVEPNGSITRYSYSNNEITTNKDGVISKKTTDATGKIISSIDDGGRIDYSYRADDQLDNIVTAGVTTSFEYADAYHRQTKLIDPSAGAIVTSYNDASRSVTQTWNSGKQITVVTNKFGQPISKTTPDFVSTYVYENGLPKSVTSTNGCSKSIDYDDLGRVWKTHESANGKTFDMVYAYNMGQLDSVSYSPFNFTVKYKYENGYLKKLEDASGNLLERVNSVNSFGQSSDILFGNDLTTLKSYSPEGLLMSVKTANQGGLGSPIQNMSFEYNNMNGTLSSRTDTVHNLCDKFSYDNLLRLKSYGTPNVPQAITYQSNGNIETKTDVGTYNYGSAYTLSSVNTNSELTNELNIDYTVLSRPTVISNANGLSATFSYNDEYDRTMMQIKQNGVEVKRRQYFDNGRYEIETEGGVEKQRLYLDGSPYDASIVAEKTSQGTKLFYIHRDNLGSVTQISDNLGNLAAEYSYDAYGRMRNVADWNVYTAVTTPELMFGRGYTGHEHLNQFGIIHMNARLYDPILGRFLAPDALVSEPDMSNSYNRYIYANNNPMMFVDINGEERHYPGESNSGSSGSFSPSFLYPSGSGYGWDYNFGGSANYNGGNNGGYSGSYNYGGGGMYNSSDSGWGYAIMSTLKWAFGPHPKKQNYVGTSSASSYSYNTNKNLYVAKTIPSGVSTIYSGGKKRTRLNSPANSGGGGESWYSSYNWPWLGSSARTMDALYAGDYVSSLAYLLTCATEVLSLGSASFGINLSTKGVSIAAKGVVQAEKVSGSYLLEFQSGKFYAGKGLEPRMMQSINRIETTYGDKLLNSQFFPASSTRGAFINEHNLMMRFGGPKSFNPLSPTYNKIFSPGRKLGGF